MEGRPAARFQTKTGKGKECMTKLVLQATTLRLRWRTLLGTEVPEAAQGNKPGMEGTGNGSTN